MPNSIASFAKEVELLDIFLKASHSDCFVFPGSIDPAKLDLKYKYDFQVDATEPSKVFLSFISLEVKAFLQDTEDEQFNISAQYVLAYSFKNFSGEVTTSLLNEFSSTNALFNAYPFLRETILNTSTKMSLPPVMTPLLKPGSKIAKTPPVPEATKTEKSKISKKPKSIKRTKKA